MLGVLADAPDHAAGTKPTYVNDMQAKWRGQGRMTSSCTLLSTVTALAPTLIERVLRFSWVLTWKKVALLLLESNYDACSLSLSPRRRKGGVPTGRRR